MSQRVPVDAELQLSPHHCVEALPNGRELVVEASAASMVKRDCDLRTVSAWRPNRADLRWFAGLPMPKPRRM
ncbi:hypothetical protein ABIB83_003381 [Bradyrhizobium sp. I1.8.5]